MPSIAVCVSLALEDEFYRSILDAYLSKFVDRQRFQVTHTVHLSFHPVATLRLDLNLPSPGNIGHWQILG